MLILEENIHFLKTPQCVSKCCLVFNSVKLLMKLFVMLFSLSSDKGYLSFWLATSEVLSSKIEVASRIKITY